MASPQLEHGHTRIANELLEALTRAKMNGTQFRVALSILRHSYGYGKKSCEMSDNYIAKTVEITARQANRAIQDLNRMNVIKIFYSGSRTQSRKVGINKNYSKWLCTDYLDSTDKTDGTVNLDEKVLSNLTDIKENYKEIYIYIFNYWNLKKIIVHRKLTDKLKQKIKKTLEDYTKEEIQQAIDNYANIINDDKYYFSYKWTLKDFLQRGLEKFLDDSCYSNYLKQEHKDTRQPEKKESTLGWLD